ncbi:hypothetical protein OYC64_006699 [Pagothenia borchgrevinki]|uniref:Ig-like domain-containing protein n=1 Tax=Pagothenia borchgrevinki TaxID=8213 RepID=A0ABD2GK15_PAGBO
MHCAYIVIIIPLLWVKAAGVSPDVFQTPAVVLTEEHAEVKLSCRHSINGFDSILWFLRPPGETSLQLIGFTRYTKVQVVEKPFQGFFNMSGDGETEAFLHVLRPRRPSHSGHYFCAAYSRTSIQTHKVPDKNISVTVKTCRNHTQEVR